MAVVPLSVRSFPIGICPAGSGEAEGVVARGRGELDDGEAMTGLFL